MFKKLLLLMIGFFICALGQSLFIFCDLGLNPWSVFHQGLTFYFPITIGQASQLTGLIIIVVGIFIRVYPGVGTILNMIFIGLFTDIIIESNLLYTPDTFVAKLVMCISGVLILGFGIFLYIIQELGAGPRDGLMIMLTQKTKFQVGTVRNFIEVTILIIGYILGGTVGIGTLISSLGAGFSLQLFFVIFKKNAKKLNQKNLSNLFQSKKSS